MNKPVIIGIGNEFRGDDAAGILTVRQLEQKFPDKAEYYYFQDDVLSLVHHLDSSQVCIVDTVISGQQAGTIHLFDLHRDLADISEIKFSGHSFNPVDAIQLARVNGPLPETLLFYGIEGKSFAAGTAMTEAVSKGMETLAANIAAEYINRET